MGIDNVLDVLEVPGFVDAFPDRVGDVQRGAERKESNQQQDKGQLAGFAGPVCRLAVTGLDAFE